MKSPILFLLLLCSTPVCISSYFTGAAQTNQTFYIDGTRYTLVTGYDACVAQGSGKVILAPGYTETLASAITLAGNCSIELPENGAITVPRGKEFACTSAVGNPTCDGFSIIGRNGVPNRDPGSGNPPTPGFKFICAPGAGVACFTFNCAAQACSGIRMIGFDIDTTRGNNTAVGLNLTVVNDYELKLRMVGAGTGQVGWSLNGSSSFTGENVWSFINANGYLNCIALNNNSNANYITGGCANGPANTSHVKISASSGNFLLLNAESSAVGVNFTNTYLNFGNWVLLYGQGNISDFTFGASACGNFVANTGATSSTQITVTDPGACNDVWNPFTHRFDAHGNLFANGMGSFGATRSLFAIGSLPVISVGARYAGFDAEAAGAGQDSKWWEFLANSAGSFTLQTLNDARNAASPTWTAHRDGNSSSDFTVNTLFQAGRIASSGTAPTSCAVTGAGANQTCNITATNNTDSYIELTIGAAGAGPAAIGTLTITFSSPLGSNRAICQVLPMSNSSAWNARASFQQTSTSNSSWTGNWDNNGVSLTAGSNYNVSAYCWGR